jgi:hypothetical protein
MADIEGCGPVEKCVADPKCKPYWDQFVACEQSGKFFSTCINLLIDGSGDLTLKGAAYCPNACASPGEKCDHEKKGGACATCCANAYPQGFSDYNAAASSCGCASCDASCKASTCQANQPPSDACLKCVQDSAFSTCSPTQAFKDACIDKPDGQCSTYFSCLLDCAM